MFGLSPKLKKKRIWSKVSLIIDNAATKLGDKETSQISKLQLNALKLTDFAAKGLNKDNGWNVQHLNEHCREEILASYVCFVSYFAISENDTVSRCVLKESVKLGLESIGISDGNSPAKKIELSVIVMMIKILKEKELDVEEFLGLSSLNI